jgi:hypothetical protein
MICGNEHLPLNVPAALALLDERDQLRAALEGIIEADAERKSAMDDARKALALGKGSKDQLNPASSASGGKVPDRLCFGCRRNARNEDAKYRAPEAKP